MGTVAGQIINVKRIVCDVGNQMMVCQTDDDAAIWSKTRGQKWVLSVKDAERLVSKSIKFPMTNDLWQFRHKFLAITGPGITSAQSVQVRYVQTDEAHLDTYTPGRLIEFEKRMGARWDRQATHISTAADEGKEIDDFFKQGQQDDWYLRCRNCGGLTWPTVGDKAKELYDKPVFVETVSGQIYFQCAHCGEMHLDTPKVRHYCATNGDYISQNLAPNKGEQSFRWSVFAAYWIPWRETYDEFNSAAKIAREFGNLKPLEDVTKKRLCLSWKPHLPELGDKKGDSDYVTGAPWVVKCNQPDTIKLCTADFQAGKGSEGSHLWANCSQWDRDGNSRREAFEKVLTFSELDTFRADHQVEPKDTYCDASHENRLVYREMGARKCFAIRGSDEAEIMHIVKRNGDMMRYGMPYSQTQAQNGVIGQRSLNKRERRLFSTRSKLPFGWAWEITMCNPTLYAILGSLISGSSGRYFGIASNLCDEYKDNMPAFIPIIEDDKKTNTVKRVIWKRIKTFDHPWDTEVMALVGAMRAGFFPLAKQLEDTKQNDT
jgi:hypothetical protein